MENKSFKEKAAETVGGIFNILTPSNTIGAIVNQIQGDSKNGFFGDIWKGNRGIGEYRKEGEEASNIETAINGVIDILAPLPNGAAKIAALKKSAIAAKALGKTLPIASIAKGMAQGQGTYEVIRAGSKMAGADDETASKIALGASMIATPFTSGAADQLARKLYRNASNKATPYLNKYYDSRVVFRKGNNKQAIFNGLVQGTTGSILDLPSFILTGETVGGHIANSIGVDPFIGEVVSMGLQQKIGNRFVRRTIGDKIYSGSRGASDPMTGQLSLVNGQNPFKLDEKAPWILSKAFSPSSLESLRKLETKYHIKGFNEIANNLEKLEKQFVSGNTATMVNFPGKLQLIKFFRKTDIIANAERGLSSEISKVEKMDWNNPNKAKKLQELQEGYKKLQETKDVIKSLTEFNTSYTELTGKRLSNTENQSSIAHRVVDVALQGYSPVRWLTRTTNPLNRKLQNIFIKYGGGYNSTVLSGPRQTVKSINYGSRGLKESPVNEAYLRTNFGKDIGSFFWGKGKGLNLAEQLANVIINPRSIIPDYKKFEGWMSRIGTGREIRVKSNMPHLIDDILNNGQLIGKDGFLYSLSERGQLNLRDILAHCQYNARAQRGPSNDLGYKLKTTGKKEKRLIQDTQLGHNSLLGTYTTPEGKIKYISNDINGHVDLDIVYRGKRYTLAIDVGGMGSGGGGGKQEQGFDKLLRGLGDDSADFTVVNIDLTGGRENFERQFVKKKNGYSRAEESLPQIDQINQKISETISKKESQLTKNIALTQNAEKRGTIQSKANQNRILQRNKLEKEIQELKGKIENNNKVREAIKRRIAISQKYPLNNRALEILLPHLEKTNTVMNKILLPVRGIAKFDSNKIADRESNKAIGRQVDTDLYKAKASELFSKEGDRQKKRRVLNVLSFGNNNAIKEEKNKLNKLQKKITDSPEDKSLLKKQQKSQQKLLALQLMSDKLDSYILELNKGKDVILQDSELKMLQQIKVGKIASMNLKYQLGGVLPKKKVNWEEYQKQNRKWKN